MNDEGLNTPAAIEALNASAERTQSAQAGMLDEMGGEVFMAPEVEPGPGLVSADKRSDAASRAGRTAVQGYLFAALVAVVVAVGDAVGAVDASSADWRALGLVAVQAAGTAVVSYLHRLTGGQR